MKKLRIITGMVLLALLGFTSCQSEVDNVSGDDPNTNTANSETANSIMRISSNDGSEDDFMDGSSCTSVLFPAKVTVNGIKVTLLSKLDYQQVITILARFSGDDTVKFDFPLRLKLRDYTEVTVNNQDEFNAIIEECKQSEVAERSPIFCLKFNYPITLLTYNLRIEQTGRVVINSKRDLFNFMVNLSSSDVFAIKYPISITHHDGTVVTINNNLELRANIKECLAKLAAKRLAESRARELERLLVNGKFKVQSFIKTGVDTALGYKEYTLDFTNESKVTASNLTLGVINGVFDVSSELNVFLHLEFAANASFELLNNNWKLVSMNSGTISFQSTTNSDVTLVLKQI